MDYKRIRAGTACFQTRMWEEYAEGNQRKTTVVQMSSKLQIPLKNNNNNTE